MKVIFSVVAAANAAAVGAAIEREFPGDFLLVSGNYWLIATTGTAQTVSDQLGLKPGFPASALVLSVSGYYGLMPSTVWEWIKAKWGSV